MIGRPIPNASHKLAPIIKLTMKSSDMVCTDECDQALAEIKADKDKSQGHSQPDFDKTQVLFCNSSVISYTCYSTVLMSHPKDETKKLEVVNFDSRKMSPGESSSPIVIRKFMAICFGLKTYSWFIQWIRFQLYTDSIAVLYLIKSRKTEGKPSKLIGMLNLINCFYFELKYM